MKKFWFWYMVGLLAVVGVASAAVAATLDTPPVVDPGVGNVHCAITNLHPTKTMTLTGDSGLYRAGATVNQGCLGATVSPGSTIICAYLASSWCDGHDSGSICRCHFGFTGVPKAKARAAYSSTVTMTAY